MPRGTTHKKLFTPRFDRQMKYEVSTREDGTFELVDKSPVSFKPTEEQLVFLDRLFWDWEYGLDEEKVVHSLGAQISTIRRWKRDPAFLSLYKNEANKAIALGIENAKNLVSRTLEHGYHPSRDEKWAAKQLLKIDDGIRQTELKLLSIHNTQNNYFMASADMTEEQLKEIIERGNPANGKTQKCIPEGTGKDS